MRLTVSGSGMRSTGTHVRRAWQYISAASVTGSATGGRGFPEYISAAEGVPDLEVEGLSKALVRNALCSLKTDSVEATAGPARCALAVYVAGYQLKTTKVMNDEHLLHRRVRLAALGK